MEGWGQDDQTGRTCAKQVIAQIQFYLKRNELENPGEQTELPNKGQKQKLPYPRKLMATNYIQV